VDELDDLIATWTRASSLESLEQTLNAAAVPAMRIFTIADIFGDPHYRARGAIVQAPDDDLGSVAMANVVPRLSHTPGRVRHAGHHIGGDTRRVLKDRLGLTEEALNELEASSVIRSADSQAQTAAGEGRAP
jgi:crotonobetainyl-CoA:carnitine CoA-transferase CaiB-like acyl-CoA transferase